MLAGIAAASGALHHHTRSLRLGFIFLACVFAGAGRLQAARAGLASTPLSRLHDLPQAIELIGVVFAPPDRGDRSTLILVRAETAALDGGESQSIQGAVAVLAPAETRWQYGDRVRTRGSITAPSGVGRLSPESLARAGVTSWMPRPAAVQRLQVRQGNPILQVLMAVRERAESAIRRLYADPEAALLTGILLGDESRIPESMRRDFAATGTSHIVAISGFNLTLLTGALVSVTGRWLGARRGALASAAAIVAYTALVGAAPPVSRAAVTALLALAARRIGRMSDGLASLALSGVLLTAWNPLLIGDLGFQLSFGATLGLVLYSQRLSDWSGALLRRFAPGRVGEHTSALAGDLVWAGVAAQATTLPIVIVAFRRLPWISLLANPLVLPVQPAVMSLGGLSAAFGAIWEPLGRPFAWLAWAPLAFTHHAVRMFASIPSGSLPVLDVHPIWAVAYAAILLGLVELPEGIRNRLRAIPLPRLPAVLVWTVMALAAGLVWKASLAVPDGRLHIRLLDTGGESILIESPTGRFVLLGGGPSPVALAEALGERLPVFDPRLDWVVVRSTD
ncbi:MAG: ComEC/Rec2 family competence protein, partial [Anaerolineales bacterium]